MTKCSPEFLSLADDCLQQFAQIDNDDLSSVLTSDDLSAFQAQIDEARDQAAMDRKPSNTHTSAYCKARKRLTEPSIKALMCQSGVKLDKASPDSWLWHQRRVLLTDGSTLLMPDTAENQKVYPQLKSQKKGADFPY